MIFNKCTVKMIANCQKTVRPIRREQGLTSLSPLQILPSGTVGRSSLVHPGKALKFEQDIKCIMPCIVLNVQNNHASSCCNTVLQNNRFTAEILYHVKGVHAIFLKQRSILYVFDIVLVQCRMENNQSYLSQA